MGLMPLVEDLRLKAEGVHGSCPSMFGLPVLPILRDRSRLTGVGWGP